MNHFILSDSRKCIGCQACEVACVMAHNEEQHVLTPQRFLPRITVIKAEGQRNAITCRHCEDAPCVGVCPTGAAYIGADGIVGVDHGRCIGCLYCMAACPYQVRVRNEETGAVDKCRFCTVSAETTGTKMCSCVEACLTGARMFGDLDDPDSDISKEIVATNAQPIAGDLTKSKVFYVR